MIGILEKFKRRSIRKRIAEYVEQRDSSGRNDRLKSLGLLVDESLQPDLYVFDDLPSYLGIHPNNFRLFSFLEVKKKLPSIRQNQINNKDFSFKGHINNQNALEFLDRQFDVLVGFYREKNLYMDQMVAMSQAHFKVGFSGCDESLYDLVLQLDPDDYKLFKQELKKYMKVLNKII